MTKTSPATAQVEKSANSWPFRKRWRIEGCLITSTPLHIGSGQAFAHPDLEHEGGKVEVNAHAVDHTGLATIFGSTLKGCIRAWMDAAFDGAAAGEGTSGKAAQLNLPELCEKVMGRGPGEKKGGSESVGGMAEFLDARMRIRITAAPSLPYWNAGRQTWIEASNSIDRHTGTAADKHLVHTECVPAGVGFDLVVKGFFDNEDQVAILLAALEGFNDPERPILLGADTASGKGRMRWEPGKIFKMDAADVLEWVKNPGRNMAEKDMPALSSPEREEMFQKADGFVFPSTGEGVWSIPITLNFDSHFLVNDPPGEREIADGTVIDGKTKRKTIPDHRPRMDAQGGVILPAKSFRGAFRSQGERILRTLNIAGKFACDPMDTKSSETCIKKIEHVKDNERLCLACRVFGAPGWRSPVEIGDFHLEPKDYEFEVQEFVAIDRFTGGGRDGAKFNARAIYRPVFTGILRIDGNKMPKEGLGLLALTLRDLKEGDITFGFGKAKGYATCKAIIPILEEKEFQDKVRESLGKLHTVQKKGEQ